MTLSRSIRLVYIATLLAWAACLTVLGLWFAFDRPPIPLLSSRAVILIGVASVAAGNLVFMGWIADRAFPSVSRGQFTWNVEMSMVSVFVTMITLVLLGARLL